MSILFFIYFVFFLFVFILFFFFFLDPLDPKKLIYILTTYLALIRLLANHPYPHSLNSHLMLTFSPVFMIISEYFQDLTSSPSLLCPNYWFSHLKSNTMSLWSPHSCVLCVCDTVTPPVCLFSINFTDLCCCTCNIELL